MSPGEHPVAHHLRTACAPHQCRQARPAPGLAL